MWSKDEYNKWLSLQKIKRSYQDDVVQKLKKLETNFEVLNYGEINYSDSDYPLYLVKSKNICEKKPNILITGGVHGYETSGVMGAIKFMETGAQLLENQFNFVCAPCVSPWAFETINRWNPDAIDPNRNFKQDSEAKECSLLIDILDKLNIKFLAHFDLHETTDTDNTEFRPLLEKRDGIKQDLWEIPDGFYLVGDTSRVEDSFQEAIIESVKKVTHIAPADSNGKIIGVNTSGEGIINYDVKRLHLCAGISDANFVTTTEVYPDSPKVSEEQCTLAQVAAVKGGLEYLLSM